MKFSNTFKSIKKIDYNVVAGTDWPNYYDFINLNEIDSILYNELDTFFKKNLIPTNIINNKKDYFSLLDKEYFKFCKGKTVLELGPHSGYHSKMIINHAPAYFKVIEGDRKYKAGLEKLGINEVIIDDLNFALLPPKQFDIVICFGVLYHLHNSLHILELIINNNKPELVFLDCVEDSEVIMPLPEKPNLTGNRQLRSNWKHCGLNLVLPYNVINQAMTNMGYSLHRLDKLLCQDFFTKSNSWLAIWKLNK